MNNEQNTLKYRLELLIDNHTLDTMLEAISEVCFEKAEHLRSNWQDESTAKIWEKLGVELSNIDTKGN